MSEYIERERLVKHYENCIDEVKNTNGITEDFEICLKALKNQPAVDGSEIMRGEWISVKDRLPEDDKMVLVWAVTKAGRGNVNRAYHDKTCWHGSGSMAGVTHWMPLPKPPREE